MQGLMQDFPLTVPHLFQRAETLFADEEMVTATSAGNERVTDKNQAASMCPRAARPGTRRASSTATGRPFCTRSPHCSRTPSGSASPTWCCRWSRCSMPMPGDWHTAVTAGATCVMPGPDPVPARAGQPDRGRAGQRHGGRADDLAGRPARAGGTRHFGPAADPGRRVRAGVSRSFQSVDLFADLTVRENLAAACEPGGWRRYAADIVAPRRSRLTPTALAAVRRFGLGPLDAKVDMLPFGRRRLVETHELGGFIRALTDQWGLAILLVEHNVELVLSDCDVSVLAGGADLVHGPPEQVRTDPQVLDAYVGSHGQSDAAGDVTTTIDGQG